jgi:DNA-binding response OmpR family regulator
MIPMKKKILIVDDDERLNDLLKEYLGRFEYTSRAVTNAEQAFKLLKEDPPDCIVLDVMLPGMDGFETCRHIRETHQTPIIMLTARGEVTDRVVGLEMGADDYLPKPFEPRELVARIQSLIRRASGSDNRDETASFGSLVMNYRRRQAQLEGKELDLTTMEYELLSLLTRNAGIVLERETIFERLKGLEDESLDRSIDILVSRLRGKLSDNVKSPRFIKTVRGTGYIFTGDR